MAYPVCHAPLELYMRSCHRSVTIVTMELQTGVLSILAEFYRGDVTQTSICHSYYGNIFITSLVHV